MSARNILRLFAAAFKSNDRIDFASGEKLKFIPAVNDQGSIEIGDGTRSMDLKVFLGSASNFVQFDASTNTVIVNAALNTNSAVTLSGDISANNVTATTLVSAPAVNATTLLTAVNAAVTNTVTTATINASGTVTANNVTINTLVTAAAINTTGVITPSGNSYWAYKLPAALTANTTLNASHFGALVQASTGALVLTLPTAAAGNAGAWVKVVNIVDQDLTVSPATADTLIALNDATADSIKANTANTRLGATATFISTGTKWLATPEYGTWAILT